jgi:alkylhydroperoxidase family enzyme
MATVTLIRQPKGLVSKLAFSYCRWKFKGVVDPVRVAAHHPGVLIGMGALETVVEKGWHKLDPHLRWLAVQATAGAIGCSWCMDFGYFEGIQQGVDPRKVRDVARWRQSDVYDARERVVLEYVERSVQTPADVGEDLAKRLHEHFSEPEIVELAAWVALENFRSRFNAGLGLQSQGFSDNCRVPDDRSSEGPLDPAIHRSDDSAVPGGASAG